MQSPKDLSYIMPAEWHNHSGTLLCWPANRETWPGIRLSNVEKVYVEIVRTLSEHEHIHLIVQSEDVLQRAKKAIANNAGSKGITYHLYPSNDVWVRDYGPIYILNNKGEAAITDWEYNAWGGKYPPYDADNRFPSYYANKLSLNRFKVEMVLEGGSIETNGNGVMLTTESVLLNANRNPALSKCDIENYLKSYLGQTSIIWLKGGIAGDDTDGHIDDLSRFVSENTIITALTEDVKDVNYQILQKNYEILKAATNAHGGKYDVIPIPMPCTSIEGTTVDGSNYVPASYANFYVANGIVLLPLYDKRYDDFMVRLFEDLFPDREIIGIKCNDLVWGQGGIHCITQQLY